MNKNKLAPKDSSKMKENSLIKGLLRRMEENDLTEKEIALVRELKELQGRKQERKKLSHAELNRAVRRNRQAILRKRDGVKPLTARKSIHTNFVMGAAVAALLLVLTFPLYKRLHLSLNSPKQEMADNIEYQFTTEKNIKRIILADGSIIDLNRESSLSLRKGKFNAYTREVWLDEGEAYFDIMKDPNRPFIVHSKNGVTTHVVGTSFNIKSYGDLPDQVISVNTGRVQVFNEKQERIVLDPNYKVSVSDKNSIFTAAETDAQSISDWKSGKIVFDQASVREVAFRIKQYYDKELIYDEQLFGKEQIYSFFTLETPFEEVITVVCKLMNAFFTIKEGKVYLTKKK